jgi:anti-sigma regulatory factor (Ser/Thr protein kinase)
MEHVTQEFPSELRQMAAIRTLVRDVCDRAWGIGADPETVAELQLAVDEAASNVVLHAYEGKPDVPFDVEVAADPHGVSVTLYHRGAAFDPGAVRAPTFDGSRESGFGLYIIRQAVDELSFFQDERGRHGMRMVKKRKKSPEG